MRSINGSGKHTKLLSHYLLCLYEWSDVSDVTIWVCLEGENQNCFFSSYITLDIMFIFIHFS